MSEGLAVAVEDLRFAYPERRGRAQRAESAGAAGPFRIAVDAWSVRAGERVALHGPSGSGKSTLLQLLAGILVPQQGRLLVGGRDLTRLGEGARRAHRVQSIGFVFQDFPLVEHLSAEENVLLPYRLNRALRLDRQARDRARRLLADLGVAERSAHRPAELSQGERQRVAIARALITNPTMLLADEPTAGLDYGRRDEVMSLMEEASSARGLTWVMVTHDRELLTRFDRTVAIDELLGAPEAGS
jgi:ABC-type lipoprotein export system ATPase subunit